MSDRSHPLLDRIEATQSGPPSLRAVSESILRIHWSAVTDIGDTPYSLIQSLLPLSSAAQLSLLEANSPHLVPHTNELWKALCVADFIDVRKLVEDGRLKKEDEPRSWRERYAEEEEKREVKMQAILSKMRGQYSSYSSARGTVQEVDGLRMEKRRKTSHASPARPKTLFEKARSNTRAISSIYAPKRRPQPAKAAPAPKPASSTPSTPSIHSPTAPRPSRTSTSSSTATATASTSGEERKRPVITTVVRTLKRPLPASTAPSTSRATPPSASSAAVSSRPALSSRAPSRLPSFSPPPPAHSPPLPPVRPLSALPPRPRALGGASASSPPPAGSASPPPPGGRPSAKPPSLFMPKSRRP